MATGRCSELNATCVIVCSAVKLWFCVTLLLMIVRRISCIIASPGREDNHKPQSRNTNCVVKTMGVVVKEIALL